MNAVSAPPVAGSLRLRLLAGTLAVVSTIWIALTVTAWLESRHEAEEIFDAHLAQTAALLASFVGEDADELDEHLPEHRYARKVAFQIWENGTRLLTHSQNAPDERLSPQAEGFSDANSGGREWRVYSLWDARHRYLVQVAEARAARAAVSRELAAHLILPLAVALPLLAAALALLIGTVLKPLSTLADSIGQRSPERLDAIPLTAAPRELRPILERLNHLFARVGSSLEQERRFTADAAHELRTPLAAMRTHAQVAQASRDDGERAAALHQVVAANERATHLLEQLLTLARLDSATRIGNETCALRTIAVDVLAAAAPTALARGVEIELAEDDAPPLSGNAVLLAVLLRNLVDNAIRYSPPGARVAVACRAQPGGGAVIEVGDQGPGIAPDERTHVLDRFYRIAGSGETGSGLGLSIVARIAELHGASLELDAGSDGKGLCARVVFSAPVNG